MQTRRKGDIMFETMERDRLKTAIISPYPLDQKSIGGVQSYILSLRPELQRKGCEITLIGPSIKDRRDNLADETLGISLGISMTNTNYKGGVSLNLPRAINIMRRIDPDVVWFHDPYASVFNTMTLLKGLSLKTNGIATDALFHAYTGSLTWANKRIRQVGNLSGIIGFISGRIEGRGAVSRPPAELWSKVNQDDIEKYEILPNPIDTELFTPDGPIFEDWGEDGSKVLLFAGRHDKRKRLCDAVDALAILIRSGTLVRLKVTGYGDETGNVKKQIERLGLKNFVEFLGVLSREDLIKAYRSAGRKGLVVAPSEDGEAFNRTIAEGRATGALVAATDIAGHRFSYGEEAIFGEMAKPGNPGDLAEKIAEQLDLPEEERKRRSDLGRIFAEDEFSTRKVAKKVVVHWETLFKNKDQRIPKTGTIFGSGI